MKIPGYSHWLTVFRPLSWLVPLAEQMYDVAGIFLADLTPTARRAILAVWPVEGVAA